MRSALTRLDRYNRGAVWLHWIIAVLVIANLVIGLFHESLLVDFKSLIPLHKSIGMTILALTPARIAWHLAHRPPPLPVALPAWERGAAHTAHIAFYTLLLVLPLTGWMLISGNPARPFTWFGLIGLPYLPVSKATAGAAHDAHGLLGYLMTALVAVHITAALRHHFVLRDGVLARMIPALRTPR